MLSEPRRHGGCTPRDTLKHILCRSRLGLLLRSTESIPGLVPQTSMFAKVTGRTPPISPLSPADSCRSRVSRRFFKPAARSKQSRRDAAPTGHVEAPKPSGDMGYLLSETVSRHDCRDAGGTSPGMGEGRTMQERLSRAMQEQLPRTSATEPRMALKRVSEGRYPVSPRQRMAVAL